MPHIRARGIEVEAVQKVAGHIVEQLAEVTETPNDHFTFEYISSQFLTSGGASPAYPYIEVLWFDRGQEMKSTVAVIIDKALRTVVDKNTDITVVFSDLNGTDYYENGTHF